MQITRYPLNAKLILSYGDLSLGNFNGRISMVKMHTHYQLATMNSRLLKASAPLNCSLQIHLSILGNDDAKRFSSSEDVLLDAGSILNIALTLNESLALILESCDLEFVELLLASQIRRQSAFPYVSSSTTDIPIYQSGSWGRPKWRTSSSSPSR